MRRLVPTAILACLVVSAPAAAAIPIHAHRGGPYANAVPLYPEETMPAFRNAAKRGWVLEVDAKLTSDRVPLVIHDATLDRTTPCTGEVRARTARDIQANCPADVLGSPGSGLPTAPVAEPVKLSLLADVLALARRTGAVVNLEIKNIPNESDFDPTDGFARTIAAAVRASGLPASQLIVQSFWPPNLEVVKQELPGVETALLTLQQMNLGAPAVAASRSYEWVSPQFGADFPLVAQEAHALGLRVVPWTLNDAASVAAAAAGGADAVITDDPPMAAAALG